MEIFFSNYQLVPANLLNSKTTAQPRVGALLKVTQPKGSGYSCLQPWPELGDQDLQTHLRSVRDDDVTPLARQAINLALRDLQARTQGRKLLDKALRLKNNFLISDLKNFEDARLGVARTQGFREIKLKCGVDHDRENYFIKKTYDGQNFILRLDFNSSLTWDEFERFFKKLNVKAIQYAEDPFAYDILIWGEGRKICPLAADFESQKFVWSSVERPCCDVLVIKPARQNVTSILPTLANWKIPVVVTSNMDHPVGVVHAISAAQEIHKTLSQVLNPGCLTLDSYLPDSYAEKIRVDGPVISDVEGYGIGFDSLLPEEPWTKF